MPKASPSPSLGARLPRARSAPAVNPPRGSSAAASAFGADSLHEDRADRACAMCRDKRTRGEHERAKPARRAAPFPARRMPEAPPRYVLPTIRSWVSTTASATNVSHSTAQPRDPMRRDVAEEAFRNREAPEVLEAVQQPVGVGRIAARLELPEPHEPRHAGVDRLFEQMLEVAPQPGRHPLGEAGFDPAFRVDERIGAEAARSSSWPAGWSACADRPRRTSGPGPRSTAPAVLLRGAPRRAHAPRRPRRTGIRTGGAASPDARAGSRTAPRSRRAPPRPDGAGGR